jgi:hypothetical protein
MSILRWKHFVPEGRRDTESARPAGLRTVASRTPPRCSPAPALRPAVNDDVLMARSVRTLPLASVSGGHPEFSPTNEQWKQIERAYGHALSDNVRQDIVAATINFLLFEPFERAAEPVSLARERVLTVQEAAKNLHDALVTAKATTATFYAHHLIKQHFADEAYWSRKFRGRNRDKLVRLRHVLAPLLDACKSALAELDDPNLPGHREGECWRGWVRALTQIAEQHKLPTNASRKPSPFVVLVRELERYVLLEARRHTHSYEALAKAIQRARRAGGVSAHSRTISRDLGIPSDESLYRYATGRRSTC